MKKYLVILLCLALALCTVACGKPSGGETTQPADTSQTAAEVTEEDTAAPTDTTATEPDTEAATDTTATEPDTEAATDKTSLKDVEPVTTADGDIVLTCPASFYDEYSPPSDELSEEEKNMGFKKAVVNDDGTVSYYIARDSFGKVKERAVTDTTKIFSEYPQNQPFIKKVAYNEDFSVINIQVDEEGYNERMTGVAIVFEVGLYAQLAQVMFGVQPDRISVDVVVTNADTGEVITTAHYPSDN